MKFCKYCNTNYPEEFFDVALTTKDKTYRRNKCKFCYHKTKNVLRRKKQEWLLNYKKSANCNQCKNADYRVLEFHHLDGKIKFFSISLARDNNLSLDKIRQEIEKCVILCANCHRITHWVENGW